MDQASTTRESTPVQPGRDQVDHVLALRRRAFLAAPESNPTRQVGQAESTCPHRAKSSVRPPRASCPSCTSSQARDQLQQLRGSSPWNDPASGVPPSHRAPEGVGSGGNDFQGFNPLLIV